MHNYIKHAHNYVQFNNTCCRMSHCFILSDIHRDVKCTRQFQRSYKIHCKSYSAWLPHIPTQRHYFHHKLKNLYKINVKMKPLLDSLNYLHGQ